ncbi:ABC transporter ATP-binding protein [Deinococcus sp. 14RED07]|uniref:ABC transporter transmembrane domain-containing protein n=1 Tax=Deinococcus sp. 14RED07 TaxID=2745874 RepID=UPI001E49962A|nr:ABC transporter ATP-binding protein [Deinococcus sp. 14RED07]MCD0174685.1 ABC transporter ATP-binding protein [Deinococcus sp. 14RED07]
MIHSLKFILQGHVGPFLLTLLMGTALSVSMTAANPLILKYLFDEGVMRQHYQLFVLLAVAGAVLFTVIKLLEYRFSLHKQALINRIAAGMGEATMGAFLRWPTHQVMKQGPAYFTARVHDEVQSTVAPTVRLALDLTRTTVTVITGLAVILSLSWKLTLVLSVISPILLILSRMSAQGLRRTSQEETEAAAHVKKAGVETVASHRTVRSFDLQDATIQHYRSALARYYTAVQERTVEVGRFGVKSSIFLSLAETTVIILGGAAIMLGDLTFGGLLGFMSAFWMVVASIQALIAAVPQAISLQNTTERLQEIHQGVERDERLIGAPELRDVQFTYQDQQVLRSCTVNVPSGQRTLLTGKNGAGKSTVAHLLAGHLQPDAGTVHTAERVSALVEPMVYPPLPLRVLLARQDYEWETLAAQLGLTGVLNQQFSELSLGQQKKFNVLMTLTRRADLYILDEPLANLDPVMQRVMLPLIFERTQGATLLLIAHELWLDPADFHRHIHLDPSLQAPLAMLDEAS